MGSLHLYKNPTAEQVGTVAGSRFRHLIWKSCRTSEQWNEHNCVLISYSSMLLGAPGRSECGKLPMSSKCNDESLFSPEDFLTSASSAVFLSTLSSRLEERLTLSSCSISLIRFNDNSIEKYPHGWVDILSKLYLTLLRRLNFFCKCSSFFSSSSLSNLALRLSSMALSLSFQSLCSSFLAISLPSCAFLVSSLASWFSFFTLCSSSFSRSLSCLRRFKACSHQNGSHYSLGCFTRPSFQCSTSKRIILSLMHVSHLCLSVYFVLFLLQLFPLIPQICCLMDRNI